MLSASLNKTFPSFLLIIIIVVVVVVVVSFVMVSYVNVLAGLKHILW